MFDKIAEELKNSREKLGLTLSQVANKSKIDLKFLEAMEQGDFAFLPELYVRAFMKNFARTVGLDENKIIKKFEAAKKGIPYIEEETQYEEILRHTPRTEKQESLPQIEKREKKTTEMERAEKKKKINVTYDAVAGSGSSHDASAAIKRRNMIIGSSLIGVFFLFTIIYFLFIDKSEQIIVVEKPIEDVIQQNQRYLEENQTPQAAENKDLISDSLILTINTNDTSWIRVSADGFSADEFILFPNSQKTLKAKSDFNITFGNSGAIKLFLNGRQLAFSGRSKIPLTAVIDASGLKYPEKSPAAR